MLPCISCPARCGRPQLPSLASDKPLQGQGPGLTTGLLVPRCGSSSRLQLLHGALAIHAALRQRSRWSAQRCVGHGGWSQGRGAQVSGVGLAVCQGWRRWSRWRNVPPSSCSLPSRQHLFTRDNEGITQHEPHACCAAAAD